MLFGKKTGEKKSRWGLSRGGEPPFLYAVRALLSDTARRRGEISNNNNNTSIKDRTKEKRDINRERTSPSNAAGYKNVGGVRAGFSEAPRAGV